MMPEGKDLALVDSVVLGSARGGRRPAQPQTIEVVRPLTPDDVPMLVNPPPVNSPKQHQFLALRHGHHAIARLIAEGRAQEEVALITGYSISYISTLKTNPAFAELVAYYETNKELAMADVWERMRALGLHTLDELQDRLTTEPSEWTKRELMELAELLLVKGRPQGASAGTGTGPGVNINVKFVTAAEPKSSGPTLDIVADVVPEETH